MERVKNSCNPNLTNLNKHAVKFSEAKLLFWISSALSVQRDYSNDFLNSILRTKEMENDERELAVEKSM